MILRRVSSPIGTASRSPSSAFDLAGLLVLVAAVASCSDSSAPDPLSKVPDFIYVSNVSGLNELYTWSKGTSTLLPATVGGDMDPQSAAGKVVFTGFRVSPGNAEIYIAGLSDSSAVRLTTQNGTDHQPSLSPDGSTVVFASTRSGTSRIWTMGADGSSPTALNTGSATDTPESAPRFSPSGDRILFSSPRTNTTQIWIVPAAGGTATQATHEANGAFSGSWSTDGNSVYYVDGADRTKIHNVEISGGTATDYVTGGTDVGDAECTSDICLVVSNVFGANSDIYAYVGAGDTSPISILNSAASESQPAILHH
jgi:hypothetical protein